MGRPRRDPKVRFFEKVDLQGPIVPSVGSPCHIWTAGRDRDGYGLFQLPDRRGPTRAHRYAVEMASGPIPDGGQVLHRCDTPACVRFDHLFLGSAEENVADRVEKGRTAVGGKQRSAKLTPAKVAEIRRLYAEGEGLRSLARRFGLANHSAIWKVVTRRSWKHVP